MTRSVRVRPEAGFVARPDWLPRLREHARRRLPHDRVRRQRPAQPHEHPARHEPRADDNRIERKLELEHFESSAGE